jgi:CO/xanthine dehydrogenase FAD-binding subunit
MNIAVVVILEKGAVKDVRISPGSTTPLPDRITVAEKVLSGRKPTEELIREAGKKVSEEMIARSGVRWSTPYKGPVIAALVSRALREALGNKVISR